MAIMNLIQAGVGQPAGLLRAIVTAALATTLASCPAPAAGAASSDVYRVGPGDVLEITVYAGGEKQDEYGGTLSESGTLVCPLLGEVALGGLSATEITARLRERLARDYYVNPQVIVTVKALGGSILVLGEVRQPGIYPLRPGLTALAACTLAGGFTDFAAPRAVRITRTVEGKLLQLRVDLARIRQGKHEDFTLASGDRLEVPRRVF